MIQHPWLVGTLLSNVWAGSGPGHINEMTINPFVNYNMRGGWYIASTLVWTANWTAYGGQRWTVPIGGGLGRVFKEGKQLVNIRTEVFYNAARPSYAPNWQLQVQLQLLFPEGS